MISISPTACMRLRQASICERHTLFHMQSPYKVSQKHKMYRGSLSQNFQILGSPPISAWNAGVLEMSSTFAFFIKGDLA